MNASQATLTMVLLFALRCLVPLALMFGIGYAMNWLVDRWEAEAADKNGLQKLGQETAVSQSSSGNCWSIKQCDPNLRENCPGFAQQVLPCWLARTRTEGILPAECTTCPLYKQKPSFA